MYMHFIYLCFNDKWFYPKSVLYIPSLLTSSHYHTLATLYSWLDHITLHDLASQQISLMKVDNGEKGGATSSTNSIHNNCYVPHSKSIFWKQNIITHVSIFATCTCTEGWKGNWYHLHQPFILNYRLCSTIV